MVFDSLTFFQVAMTVNTRVIKLFLHNNSLPYVKIEEGLRLQVLPDMSYLARAAKHHFAAFIADQGLLVVWDDEPRKLLERAERIEKQLMAMIWQGESAYPQEKEQKTTEIVTEVAIGEDGLEANLPEKPRPIIFIQPILTACTLALVTTVIGVGFAKIAQEIYIDNNYIRLAFLLVVPPQIWLALVSDLCPSAKPPYADGTSSSSKPFVVT